MGNIYLLIFGSYLIFVDKINASWGTPGSGQYHIQTDEGPERYFKYQTDNGQFRKEKRLQDGTVIGTDAWIDALGYLRQKDYIADSKGYRILKSKTVFVGKNRPIQEALNSAKNKPATAGILVPSSPSYTPSTTPIAVTTPSPITASTPGIKSVYIRPHSQPILTNYLPANIPEDKYLLPKRNYSPSSSPRPEFLIPTSTYSPILSNEISSTPFAIYSPSSTPSSIIDESHLPPLVLYNTQQKSDHIYPNPSTISPIEIQQLNNELLPPKAYSNFNVIPLPSSTASPPERILYRQSPKPYVAPILASSARPYVETSTANPAIQNNKYDTQPLFNRNLIEPQQNYQIYQPSSYKSRIGNGYDPQYQQYDGVSVTNNGFRYYLPRQYHEENNSGGSVREGSFGYIDPFGIRRVTYYNTGPGQGFVHRKNNRYVGFNATPYDPRPV